MEKQFGEIKGFFQILTHLENLELLRPGAVKWFAKFIWRNIRVKDKEFFTSIFRSDQNIFSSGSAFDNLQNAARAKIYLRC